MLIREEHNKIMHGGIQATLNAQQNFWIFSGRNAVKRVIDKCVICAHAEPTNSQYVMGDLPKGRLSLERPFLIAGVDYCGSVRFFSRNYQAFNL